MAYDSAKPANDGFLADFPPEMREQLRAIVNDAVVNALKVQGLLPGNTSGNLAVSNGNLCTNLNAEMLGGKKLSYFSPEGHAHSAATGSTNGFMLNTDKTKLDSIEPGAEVNKNAFGSIQVGDTTIQADSKEDTLEIVAGANIAVTPDAANDRLSIAVTGKVTSAAAADTAATLQNARTIGISGAITGTATSFNGGSNITIPVVALDVGAATAGILTAARGGTGAGNITGLIKGNGSGAMTAAVAGADYAAANHAHTKANISDFPASLPASGGNADTVGGLTVAQIQDGVPKGSIVAVLSGTIAHGGTIPLPSGYTQEQCAWLVSPYQIGWYNVPGKTISSNTWDGDDDEYCYADANRVVTCRHTNANGSTYANKTANYIIIGVK